MSDSSPIIIVGAGRSGTKLLRSILNSAEDTVAFPREINYIWRHGNAEFPTDELQPHHANPDVAAYICRRFAQFSAKHDYRRVIEKTCANSLRLAFVHTIFPEAMVVHIMRDGRAVAESARRRWVAKPEWRYLWEKARWLPWEDVSYYAVRFLRYQIGRLQSKSGAQSSWGPRFSGIDELISHKQLIEVCGIQWRECVRAAESALAQLPARQHVTVRYEDLIVDPVGVSAALFAELGLKFSPESEAYINANVHAGNLQKWQQQLTEADLDLLMPHIRDELAQYGYSDGFN